MKALTYLLNFLLAPFVYAHAGDLRIGMIGLDTSHATAFAELLNDPASRNHVAGGRSSRPSKVEVRISNRAGHEWTNIQRSIEEKCRKGL